MFFFRNQLFNIIIQGLQPGGKLNRSGLITDYQLFHGYEMYKV